MKATIEALLASGKGLLAADESFSTIEKRLAVIGVPSTENTRRDYREMLFTTPTLNEFISGAILFVETFRQTGKDKVPFPKFLADQGIVPGIKVDQGTEALANFPGEKLTHGIDGLRERLKEYYALGARFTKWRAVISIGENLPTDECVDSNARMLALFAALSQEANLVPIVEPEILMDGSHTIERTEEVMITSLRSVFNSLSQHRVVMEHMVLKSGMVLPGKDCAQQLNVESVAEATTRCFRRTVPAAVPGIVFLSGGQSEEEAAERLNAICKSADSPWKLSFSFGRALQDSALQIWKGSAANAAEAQRVLLHRAQLNSFASLGKYSKSMETSMND